MNDKFKKYEVSRKDFENIHDEKTICGGLARTTFVIQKSTGQKCACKSTLQKIAKIERFFYNEIDALARINHPAIVPFIGYAIDNKRGYIYLKYMEKGSLVDLIRQNRANSIDPLWDDTHKLIISYGVAQAMKYLHSNNILHRDLKPQSILLDTELHPYISSFSTSKGVDDPIDSKTIHQTTVLFMAPEFIEDPEKYNRTKPIDVYSYAMVLYYIWTEQLPYDENNSLHEILDKVLKNERPKFPSAISPNENWQHLITRCWDQSPGGRPTFSEICSLLESEHFVTSNIDKNMFQNYKKIFDSMHS